MTIQEALRAAVAELSGGSESPQAEAEELLGRLLGLRRTEIHLNGARLVSREQARTLAKWIERRRAGEPIEPSGGELRDYGVGAQILIDLGVKEMVLLSNSIKSVVGLEGFGLKIVGQKPVPGRPSRRP